MNRKKAGKEQQALAFAHLHVHTEYSLLDGSNKIKEYVKRVKSLGMTAAAITDHGVMYGVVDFYKECLAADIRPVIGCEVYVAPGSRFDREPGQNDDRYSHLILLAENDTGYHNLIKIVSKGFVDGFYYRPRVDKEVLTKYHEGIICLSACLAGEVPKFLMRGFYEEAKECALSYQDIFGKGNYFLELQDHGIPEQQTVNTGLLRMSEETGIPLVATNDCHYTYEDDWEAHDILLCIQTGKKVQDENRMRYQKGKFYVKSEEEMRALFPYAQQAIDNTQLIADRCNVKFEFNNYKIPRYQVPEGYTEKAYLEMLCAQGLEKRYPPNETDEEKQKMLKDRLEYELGVINQMGYTAYFLIVWDYINYAKTHGIPVGPGRGSAAGSLVSYTMGITDIDPIRYDLIFERFLSPARISMPDIDVDFSDERRGEVIAYVVEKYGKDCVTQIQTFGAMLAKGVIRDVGRALDLPYAFCDRIAKMIPNELGMTIEKAMQMNPELRSAYETDESVTRLINMARRLEGLPRNASTHAAGVVIAPEPMDEFVPLSLGKDDMVTTQFTMTTIEELGLLKMDFLGLRTLSVIENAVRLIEQSQGIHIDIDRIDVEEKEVFDYLGTGRTEGVFQLESAGMRSFMKELKPESMEDVIAGISLYRPGPMEFIPAYIRGKNDREHIVYDSPALAPILSATYGCIVYQEQVMQIVQNLAGYSLGGADEIRRAMSKKKQYVIDENREIFVNGGEFQNKVTGVTERIPGCVANGIPAEIANKIYDHMVDFAKYAFNKSHAAAYAAVSYQTAWLKYHYPTEFMAALMTSMIDNSAKLSEYILTAKNMGIGLLPPDVNEGIGTFSVSGNNIRYGLSAVKSIGRPMIELLLRERELNGPFRSLPDFITRLTGKKDVNKRTYENLIKAGALDCLPGTRKQKLLVYGQILETTIAEQKSSMTGQMSLFDIADEETKEAMEFRMPDVGEFDKEQLLAFEKEVLGIYTSGHPLEAYEDLWRKGITAKTSDFLLDEETGQCSRTDGEVVTIGGMIAGVTMKYTKTNQAMAFLTVEDLVGSVEVIVFPRDYEKYRESLFEDAKIFIQGKVSVEEEKDAKLICQRIVPFDSVKKELWLQFETKEAYAKDEEKILEMLSGSDGDDAVVIYISSERALKRLPKSRNIKIDAEIVELMSGAIGAENVKVVEKPGA